MKKREREKECMKVGGRREWRKYLTDIVVMVHLQCSYGTLECCLPCK